MLASLVLSPQHRRITHTSSNLAGFVALFEREMPAGFPAEGLAEWESLEEQPLQASRRALAAG